MGMGIACLRKLLEVGIKVMGGGDAACDVAATTSYKETQIHGPICLAEHVECLVANKR